MKVSEKKKLKDKSFAAKVNRHEITAGAEELGVNFDDHIMFVLKSLSGIAKDIGLNP